MEDGPESGLDLWSHFPIGITVYKSGTGAPQQQKEKAESHGSAALQRSKRKTAISLVRNSDDINGHGVPHASTPFTG